MAHNTIYCNVEHRSKQAGGGKTSFQLQTNRHVEMASTHLVSMQVLDQGELQAVDRDLEVISHGTVVSLRKRG